MGELLADAQGDWKCPDRQLRRLRGPVSQADEGALHIAPDDAEFVDRLIETSFNLLGRIYGSFYFPTFSNSLKEIGRYLGFEWTWPRASGAAAPLLRRAWELVTDEGLKRELIAYNMDDCRAAAMVADALVRICGGRASALTAVHVSSLEVGFEQTWGKFDSALPAFAKINDAAYWDYQRDRIYIRSGLPDQRRAGGRECSPGGGVG